MEAPYKDNQDPTRSAIVRVTETMAGSMGGAALSEARPGPIYADMPGYELFQLDLHDLLDKGLVDAGMPGRATNKYYVPGHPDLLVRQPLGAKMNDTIKSTHAAHILGLPMTPHRIVTHNGEVYHVTMRITGQSLDELLARTPAKTVSAETFDAIDTTWEKITRRIISAYREGISWPSDIEGPNQYMWGTIQGHDRPQVWLTDLPTNSENLRIGDTYANELLLIATSVCEIERGAGTRTEKARAALAKAIALCPDSRQYGDGLRNAILYCLEHNLDLYTISCDQEKFIEARRTR